MSVWQLEDDVPRWLSALHIGSTQSELHLLCWYDVKVPVWGCWQAADETQLFKHSLHLRWSEITGGKQPFRLNPVIYLCIPLVFVNKYLLEGGVPCSCSCQLPPWWVVNVFRASANSHHHQRLEEFTANSLKLDIVFEWDHSSCQSTWRGSDNEYSVVIITLKSQYWLTCTQRFFWTCFFFLYNRD